MPKAINFPRAVARAVARADPSMSLPKCVPAHLLAAARPLAKRYVWWEPPGKTLRNFPRFLAHSMNLATWKDQCWLEAHIPPGQLLMALQMAPAGAFTRQSWNYWHVRLGRSTPSFPQKRIPA